MHFLSVPWKLTFAIIPPTGASSPPSLSNLLDYWGGWACFVVSIAMIGVLTAIIGDLASQFGCWVGLKDAVTAITFVALGTSVPGRKRLKQYKTSFRHICVEGRSNTGQIRGLFHRQCHWFERCQRLSWHWYCMDPSGCLPCYQW